ncbi:hypothetical protein [Catenuloplanes sp. NPDC020197]|uniref:hypothetical protein n=1 Tax=Catenuloplanes sp. NPDC020197 TaxID=3363958 RepID=UPI000AB98E71
MRPIFRIKTDRTVGHAQRGAAGSLPYDFDAGQWKQRNTIERGIGRLQQHRAVATPLRLKPSCGKPPITATSSGLSRSYNPVQVTHAPILRSAFRRHPTEAW